ncbi:MAG: Clp protease N-terminal domain-containing protein [Pseudonocardiales bacterium]
MTSHLPDLGTLITTIEREFAPSDVDRVGSAVTVAAELGALGDRLVTHFVGTAREAGCSWAQIGEQLGVSKQAAQQGFVAPPKRGRFSRRPPLRMDELARAAVVVAQEQARALRHEFIGTEHLLLGLLGQQAGAAAGALGAYGITADAVRDSVERIAGRGTAQPPNRHLRVSARGKKVLQLALREATAARAPAIGPHHILLGILRDGEGLACEILVQLGADLRQLRADLGAELT